MSAGHSADFELRVITSDESDATRRVIDTIVRRLPNVPVSAETGMPASRRGSAVYVAVGVAAFQAALAADLANPLISLFVSAEAFRRLLDLSPAGRDGRRVTAIYAETGPTSQMQLIRGLYRRRVSVGVLLSARTAPQEEQLRRAAAGALLDIDVHVIQPDQNAFRDLTRFRASPVLLAVPDPQLYTADNLRNILESTYRRNQGLIGFSTALVKAGMVAASYSSVEDTVAQLGDVARALAAGRSLTPQYPSYWRVAVNESVARSLNIVVDDTVRTLGNSPP